jgi:predicted enzyme related to lactoylglutathione lyase
MKNLLIITIFIIITNSIMGQNNNIKDESPILGLRTVVYKVPDLNKAISWYSKAFKLEPYFNEPYYVGFNIGGYELGLLPSVEVNLDSSDHVITYWGVKDIHKEFNRFIELGAKSHEEPTNVGGELMVASIFDPWGNIIGLIYNPAFKPEEIE